MTNQEAIVNIKRLKQLADRVESPEEYFKHMQGHTRELSLILTVFDVASSSKEIEKALEKQIPKKAIKVDSGVYDYDFDYQCPTCRSYIDENEHHCDCGQAISFEGVEE